MVCLTTDALNAVFAIPGWAVDPRPKVQPRARAQHMLANPKHLRRRPSRPSRRSWRRERLSGGRWAASRASAQQAW
eukprot:15477195-Alexandrium_andersonii.AAC.1